MSYHTEYQNSLQDPEGFWARQAQKLDWYRPADKVLSTDEDGLYRWFKGAMTNTAYLALDYHVEMTTSPHRV